MLSFQSRRALLPALSWSASLSPLKKRLKTSVRVRAPKAAGGAALTVKSTTRTSKSGLRTSARVQPRWSLAAVVPALLLTSALTGCDQQSQPQQSQPQSKIVEAGSKEAQALVRQQREAASVPQAQEAAQPASTPEPWKPSTPDETAVQQRAKERWDALVARDFDRAWNYLVPAVREKIKQEDYKSLFGTSGVLENASVYRAVCGKARCAVRIELASKIEVPGFARNAPVTTYFDEEWRKEDDQWWYRGTAGEHESAPDEEPLPSAADPLPPATQPASGAAWGP